MEKWRGIRFFDEAAFDRKLRREKKETLRDEDQPVGVWTPSDLILGQLHDLIDGLDLPLRSRDVLLRRIDGWTLREIASGIGLSRQRVERIWDDLRGRLPRSFDAIEARMVPGRAPHYGWQEVYLASVRGR